MTSQMATGLKLRSEVAKMDCWDLSPLYASVEQFNQDYEALADLLPKIVEFKGRLGEEIQVLACLELKFSLVRKLYKLYTWANLKQSEDLADEVGSSLLKRMQSLDAKFQELTAFIDPELLSTPETQLVGYVNKPEFAFYRMYLKDLLNQKQHILTDAEEAILAKAAMLWDGPYQIFSAFDNVDADFGEIELANGEVVTVTHGNLATLLEHTDRNVRRDAYAACYQEYERHIHTLTEVIAAELKQHRFIAEVRKYKSALAASLIDDFVPESVYHNLVSSVRDLLPTFHQYIAKRAVKLGLNKLNMWDLRVPLFNVEMRFSYEEAVDLVLKACAPMGEEYVKALEAGLTGGWVDRYENKGKRSGAFSGGCYDSWPYILLNFDGSLNDVYTLAHEAGHSMHSYLANQNQPYGLADYPIFTAEIASTVCERLLTDYLLKIYDGEERQYILQYEIDAIRATFFRQTMFAEFELKLSEFVAKGTPITKELLLNEYEELNFTYYGEAMARDNLIRYEWARIPHFYYNFYVYKYATGISAAYAFSEQILAGNVEPYLALLKAGGSDEPLVLIRQAGVDMQSPEFYQPLAERFAELVGQID
jgi:oligoendopeptidase F